MTEESFIDNCLKYFGKQNVKLKSFSSPALKIAVTLAVCLSSGKIPCNKGLLKDPKTVLNNIEAAFIMNWTFIFLQRKECLF